MKKQARKNRVFKPTSDGSITQSEISTRIITNSQQKYADGKSDLLASGGYKWDGYNSRISSYINDLMNVERQDRESHYDNNYYPLPLWYQNVVGALAIDLSVECI